MSTSFGWIPSSVGDWLAFYAAVVATLLWLRDVRKVRPKVRTLFSGSIHEDDNPHDIARTITLQNLSEVPTAIDQIVPAIPKQWVPRRAIPTLARFGLVPVQTFPNGVVGRWWTGQPITVGPFHEVPKRVSLWPEHRTALNDGRLLLLIRHSYSHGLTEQIPVRLQPR